MMKEANQEEYYMRLALEEARKARDLDEVPIGCVIVKNHEVIARAYNRKTLDKVATYHAEILAIEEACRKLKSWYLDECTLYTTVEPCLMCTGAILQSRIPKVVYGTRNADFGYLSKMKPLKIEVTSDILREECAEVLSDFFRKKRQSQIERKEK